MKVNLGQSNEPAPAQNGAPAQGGTFIDWNNMKRERVMLDQFGNEIDPRTKRIIKKNDDPSS